MMSEYNAKNGAALASLIKDQGVQLREFNDEIYDSFGTAANEVFEEVRAHSPLAKKIDEFILWNPVKENFSLEGTPDDPRFAYVKRSYKYFSY